MPIYICPHTWFITWRVRGVNDVPRETKGIAQMVADVAQTVEGIHSINLENGKIVSITLEVGTCLREISNRTNLWLRKIELFSGKKIPELVSQSN